MAKVQVLDKPTVEVKKTTKPAKAPEPDKGTKVHVRYNGDGKCWAVVDPENNGKPIQNFTYGIMEDVEFRTISISEWAGLGCGSARKTNQVGAAYGYLKVDTHGKDFSGFHNMGFNGSQFTNEDQEPLTTARKLRLMPDRRALYKV